MVGALVSPLFPYYLWYIVYYIFILVLSPPNDHALIDFWYILHPVIVVFPYLCPFIDICIIPLGLFITQKDSLYINVETHYKARSFNVHQQPLFPHGFLAPHDIELPTLLHKNHYLMKQQHNTIYNNNSNDVLFIKRSNFTSQFILF